MSVPRQLNRVNCIERILNGETSKKTHNTPNKKKKTTKISENSKEYRGCVAKYKENYLMKV